MGVEVEVFGGLRFVFVELEYVVDLDFDVCFCIFNLEFVDGFIVLVCIVEGRCGGDLGDCFCLRLEVLFRARFIDPEYCYFFFCGAVGFFLGFLFLGKHEVFGIRGGIFIFIKVDCEFD